MSVSVEVVPSLEDNYIYLAVSDGAAVVIDPGDCAPAAVALSSCGLSAEAILVTHRHADHMSGVGALSRLYPEATIYAPAECNIAGAREVSDGTRLSLLSGALSLETLSVPGHTLGHVAFYGSGLLFCGDALFACGCGRMFEGTATQMYESVLRLSSLPPETRTYCGHEYTLSNIAFARAAEPDNESLLTREHQAKATRARGLPTMPFTISEELATNPFIRVGESTLIASARVHGSLDDSPVSVFAALRGWKDEF